jgi:hypothetical protein
MSPTKLAIFDFDGTLFRSPSRPMGWSGAWWGNPQSLARPFVPEVPSAEWWNESVVERAKRDIENENTMAVLITGRGKNKFTFRIRELLAQAGLKFDHVFLSPDEEDTKLYKLRVLTTLMSDNPSVRNVDIWEDTEENIQVMSNYVEGRGRAAFPHLVTVSPHAPEVEYMAARVADRFRGAL